MVLSAVDLDLLRFVQEPIGSNTDHQALRHWHEFVGRAAWLSDHRLLGEASFVTSTDDITDQGQLVETPFYRNCLRPHDIVSGLVMVVERTQRAITWLHVLQNKAGRAFGAREASLLRSFHPLLAETLRIARRLDDLEALRDGFMDAIDHVSAGVALITGRQVTCNRIARAILDEQDGLQLQGGRLKAAGDQSGAFQDLLAQAWKGISGDISLARPSGKRAFDVSVRAVGHGKENVPGDCPAVAVFIVNPGDGPPVSATYLRQAFGLTRAEATIATYLGNGRSSADIAEGLGIGVETVRGHIKNILVKTGTSRQAELVALIANRPIV